MFCFGPYRLNGLDSNIYILAISVLVMTIGNFMEYHGSSSDIYSAIVEKIEEKVKEDKWKAMGICKSYRMKFEAYFSRNSERDFIEGSVVSQTLDAVKKADNLLYFKIGGLTVKDFRRNREKSRRLTAKILDWRVNV